MLICKGDPVEFFWPLDSDLFVKVFDLMLPLRVCLMHVWPVLLQLVSEPPLYYYLVHV